jgi:hypothetical protein
MVACLPAHPEAHRMIARGGCCVGLAPASFVFEVDYIARGLTDYPQSCPQPCPRYKICASREKAPDDAGAFRPSLGSNQ